jgi:hypothetical protein
MSKSVGIECEDMASTITFSHDLSFHNPTHPLIFAKTTEPDKLAASSCSVLLLNTHFAPLRVLFIACWLYFLSIHSSYFLSIECIAYLSSIVLSPDLLNLNRHFSIYQIDFLLFMSFSNLILLRTF